MAVLARRPPSVAIGAFAHVSTRISFNNSSLGIVVMPSCTPLESKISLETEISLESKETSNHCTIGVSWHKWWATLATYTLATYTTRAMQKSRCCNHPSPCNKTTPGNPDCEVYVAIAKAHATRQHRESPIAKSMLQSPRP